MYTDLELDEMMQEKQILLARPNKFLVDRMVDFLERNNYETHQLSSLDQLPHVQSDNLHGIVISTGAISEVKENYVAVYNEVSKRFPDVPVAFTVTSNKLAVNESIKQNLLLKGLDVQLMSVAEASAEKEISSKIVLVIHEDDLLRPSSNNAATHFFK